MQIVPLGQAPADSLSALFEEELKAWQDQLHWDYRPAIRLVGSFIQSKTLPGYVALNARGAAIGYAYYVIDQAVGFVGGLFVAGKHSSPQRYGQLLDSVLEALHAPGRVRRIESQVFPFNCALSGLFEERGFLALRRFFLCLNTGEGLDNSQAPPPDFRISHWEPHLLKPVSETIYDSYQGSPDFELCRDYQTKQGCLRFVRNLIENPACGQFDPKHTLVGMDSNGQVSGVLLTSCISKDTGMVPQVSVRRDCQGKGLGSYLLRRYLRAAGKAGLKRVCLSVSQANRDAFRLYQRLGFEVSKEFEAFVWERHDKPNI